MRWSPIIPARPRCPHRRLRRLLADQLPAGLALHAPSTLRPWASASFIGARHLFPCVIAAGAALPPDGDLPARLAAVEWHLTGHIVADVAVEPDGAPGRLRIEVLTVED